MKVGIDSRKLDSYAKRLLVELPKKSKETQFVFFFDSRIAKEDTKKFKRSNVRIKYFPFSRYRRFIGYAYSQILVSAFLLKEQLSVFHATAGTMPIVYPGRSVLNIWKVEKSLPARALQGQIIGAAKKVIVSNHSLKKELVSVHKIKNKEKIVLMGSRPQIFKLLSLYRGVVSGSGGGKGKAKARPRRSK